jgi:3-hydroxyethyl bacteriochlorophyllide a dehydrogenase
MIHNMKCPAVVFLPGQSVDVREVGIPSPGPGESLVRITHSGISAGTELRILDGGQFGAPDEPCIGGYSAVGVVAEGPRQGERVWTSGTQRASIARLWGGHTAWAVVKEGDLVEVPEGIPSEQAAFGAQLGIARRGLAMAQISPDDRVLVLGLGPIGMASLVQAAGMAQTSGWDLNADRRSAALAAGLPVREPEPGAFDVVIDATGSPSAIGPAIELLAQPGWEAPPAQPVRLVVQGSYPGDFTLNYNPCFFAQMSLLFPRHMYPADLEQAWQDAAAGRFNLQPLAESVIDFSLAPQAYADLKVGRIGGAALDWSRA